MCNEKIKIIFCIRDFKQGGIPRCLQSLLMNIDKDKYLIDLVCLYHNGIYKDLMSNCKIVREDYLIKNLLEFSKTRYWFHYFKFDYLVSLLVKIIRAFLKKIFGVDILYIRLSRIAKKLGKYHVAIAYAEGLPAYFIEKVDCNNKLIWIHNDYSYESFCGNGTNFEVFNKICCVSKSVAQSFGDYKPNLKNKIISIHNFINEDYIKSLAIEKVDNLLFNTNNFTICSIGRICYPKQFEIIPQIAYSLKKRGCCFFWYVIGSGPRDEVLILDREIEKYDVEDVVIKLGEQNNPYKFLAKSDLFVLTSRYESYPTVINEALVLNIPIVSSNIPSIYEMFKSGVNGEIVDVTDMEEVIYKMINDENFYNNYKKNQFYNHNKEIMQQLEDLF